MGCIYWIKRLKSKNFLYSSKSHYLLNYLSLKISDKEISENFTRYRLQSAVSCWWAYFILALLLFFWRLSSLVFTHNGDPIQTILSAYIVFAFLIVFSVMIRRAPRLLQHIIFTCVLLYGLMINLAVRDKLPDSLRTRNKSNYDFVLITIYFLTTSLNINSFKFTTFVTSPTFVVAYIFQQIAVQQSFIDSGCELVGEDKGTAFQRALQKFPGVAGVCALNILRQYFEIKEASELIISKAIIQR